MKSLFLPLLLCISLVSIGQGTYHKLLGPNKAWDVAHYFPPSNGDFCPIGMPRGGTRHELFEDTIINDVVYKKIASYQLSQTNEICSEQYLLEPEQKPYINMNKFLREDTLAKKVYLWVDNTQEEYLLYDFTLIKGDTLNSYLTDDPFLTVQQVDSFLLETGEYHKRWIFNSDKYYIEGVGSSHGFIESLDFFEEGSELKTVIRNDEVLYGGNSFVVLGKSTENLQEQVMISPNPVQNTLNIKASQKLGEIRMYDAVGKLILVTENKSQIDCSQLKEGVFYIEIFDENNLLLQRQRILK